MSARKLHIPSVLQLLVSALGLITLIPAAGGLALFGMISAVNDRSAGGQTVALFNAAWIALISAALLTPSLIQSVQRLSGKPPLHLSLHNPMKVVSLLLVMWAALLLLGARVSQSALAWVFFPPLLLAVVFIPLWWVIEFARRGLPGLKPQHEWGLVGFSLAATMPLILLVETLIIIAGITAGVVYVISQPELAESLLLLAQRISNVQTDPEALLRILQPYLRNPTFIFIAILFTAGVVPFIEELFKPLALWFIADRQLTPAAGFIGGVICGAVFALLETLAALSAPTGNSWAMTAAARLGTGLLHTAASGLVGWGLASAWASGEYLRLAGAYLAAVAFHGIWNIFGILLGLSSVVNFLPESLLGRLSQAAPLVLPVLAVILLTFLFAANRLLRKSSPIEKIGQPAAPAIFQQE